MLTASTEAAPTHKQPVQACQHSYDSVPTSFQMNKGRQVCRSHSWESADATPTICIMILALPLDHVNLAIRVGDIHLLRVFSTRGVLSRKAVLWVFGTNPQSLTVAAEEEGERAIGILKGATLDDPHGLRGKAQVAERAPAASLVHRDEHTRGRALVGMLANSRCPLPPKG
eukprot:scaffold1163_cov362-Prasinococcus_capsulatus_cf.AAC.18